MDFFTRKGLITQTAHDEHEWPLVVLKELLDNALDACEEASILPEIAVVVDKTGITVSDNGPGMPASTIKGIVDFSVRVSSREAYVSPTRGKQGQALMTLVAMSFVLDGQNGRVDITTGGITYVVMLSVDKIAGEPSVRIEQVAAENVKTGTSIKVWWPNSASSLVTDAEERFLQLADGYAWFNPHLALTVDWFDSIYEWEATTTTTWEKWGPSDPTSPHWYKAEDLERLLCAYIKHDRERGVDRHVREVVKEFYGLTASAKQKAVLKATGLSRTTLGALAGDDGIDPDVVQRLLLEMQRQSKHVKPKSIGLIGEDHMRQRCESLACDMDTFRYKRVLHGDQAGTSPAVVEVAFVCRSDESEERRIISGVNWSPGIQCPFRSLGYHGGLESLLEEFRAGDEEPVVMVVHVATPTARYANSGKNDLAVDDNVGMAIYDAVKAVTKCWTKQRKAEERNANARTRRAEALARRKRMSVKEAFNSVMVDAYMQASYGNTQPAKDRQIYYAARPRVLELTGRDSVKQSDFNIRAYMAANPKETADWDVIFDARGSFVLPHTDITIPLGTVEVRDYIRRFQQFVIPPIIAKAEGTFTLYPTAGPKNRISAVLFIEKEGFGPIFKATHLAERYDLAIMSTKGMTNAASRKLADHVCGAFNLPLFVLHDFDKAGFSILGTLTDAEHYTKDGRLRPPIYQYVYDLNVVDLGVRLEDIEEYELQSETVYYKRSDPRRNMIENGVTKAEADFLCREESADGGWRGERVELNALVENLVPWIEGKLKAHGVKKMVPEMDVLADAYRRVWQSALIRDRTGDIVSQAAKEAAVAHLPENLDSLVRKRLRKYPAMPWDEAVSEIAERELTKVGGST
jgi:DNA topoisomerase VI subunit B